jgi:hypothetical protein
MKIYQYLDKAVYLVGDGPLAVISENKNGCTALAFETEAYAKSFINEHIKSLASRDIEAENPEIQTVKDSYEFMQLCAKHGYAGIELLSEEDQKSFIFCVRLEEIASELPTALAYNQKGISCVKTKFKEFEEPTYTTIKEWQRYDILDRISSRFAVNQPFRNWKNKEFYEIRPTAKFFDLEDEEEFINTAGSYISLFSLPCRMHYNAKDGSVPFFTDLELVGEFLNSNWFTSRIGPFFNPKIKSIFNEVIIDKSELNNFVEIVKIDDIKARVYEIGIPPTLGFCINPNGPRDSTGYIIKHFDSDNGNATFFGVSGSWEISPNNIFTRIKQRNSWDNYDTFYWNGINGYKLKTLDRSFSAEAHKTSFSDLPDADVDDLISSIFKEDIDESINYSLPDDIDTIEKLNKYILISWDPISSGEDMNLLFDSILDVIRWLWQYECVADLPSRINGVKMFCGGPNMIPNSKNPELEKSIHEKLQFQFKKLYKKVILSGYSPLIGENISGLVNQYFKTIHIDCIGFFKDIIWQSYDDDLDEITTIFEIPADLTDEFSIEKYKQIDPSGADMGMQILGDTIWGKLSDRSKYFISSSLSQLKLLGTSPQLDYSLVSIGFVKALEYELGLLFKTFSLSTDLSKVEYDNSDYGEKALVDLSINDKGKLPSLGSMGHLIKPNQRDKNELRKTLGEYIDNLNCGQYLVSKKFWKEGIFKVTNKYRNGGAHDSAISMETAIECMNYILGNEEVEGVLKKIMV